MPDSAAIPQPAPREIQEVARDILAAIRAVRLYPENNPIHAQAVGKSYEQLRRHLDKDPEYHLSVHKTGFASRSNPIELSQNITRSIASDIYAKGVREIVFMRGLTEEELRALYAVITMQQDDLKQMGGAAPLLWERGVVHVRVREAALNEAAVRLAASQAAGSASGAAGAATAQDLRTTLASETVSLYGRTIGLYDLVANPLAFGKMALDMSAQAGAERSKQEDRLLDIFRETGRQVLQRAQELREPVFLALANSVLSMEPERREGLIARRLFPSADGVMIREHQPEPAAEVPHHIHELLSARLGRNWTAEQVSRLIQKACTEEPARRPDAPGSTALPADLGALVKELSDYSPEELEVLGRVSEAGGEDEALGSIVSSLLHVARTIAASPEPSPSQDDQTAFARSVGILEDAHDRLLTKRVYHVAAEVLRFFRTPVGQVYRQRMTEALKRAAEKKKIQSLIDVLRGLPRGSVEFSQCANYLAGLDREATPVLLEMLSEEEDRYLRKLLVQLLKDLGKNQIALLGEKLADERWYFVRNIVSILGESRKEEAVEFLATVSRHRNFQIRQEVVRALMTIGGKKAADLLVQLMGDRDIDIRFMAIRGLGAISAGERGEQALLGFLGRRRWFRREEVELKLEAIASLARIGGSAAAQVLKKKGRSSWWRRGRQQREIAAAARQAAIDIERRLSGGSIA